MQYAAHTESEPLRVFALNHNRIRVRKASIFCRNFSRPPCPRPAGTADPHLSSPSACPLLGTRDRGRGSTPSHLEVPTLRWCGPEGRPKLEPTFDVASAAGTRAQRTPQEHQDGLNCRRCGRSICALPARFAAPTNGCAGPPRKTGSDPAPPGWTAGQVRRCRVDDTAAAAPLSQRQTLAATCIRACFKSQSPRLDQPPCPTAAQDPSPARGANQVVTVPQSTLIATNFSVSRFTAPCGIIIIHASKALAAPGPAC